MALAISKLIFLIINIAILVPCVLPYQFQVGGDKGWIKPSSANFTTDLDDPYNIWAGHNRFRVGDKIYFGYENDSVLVVGYEDYDKCTTGNPISEFDDGNTVFEFKRSGFFYFISGQPDHCTAGQRMIIRVMHPSEYKPRGLPLPPDSAPSPGVHGLGPSSFHSSTTRISALATFVLASLMLILYLFI